MWERFANRHEAGRLLARKLLSYRGDRDAVVLGLPRGGVPVAYEVARELDLPLDVFMVRKLGVPGHEEFAFGSIAMGGTRFINTSVVRSLRMTDEAISRVVESEELELARREKLYRAGRPDLDVNGKKVIIVDDGLATGSTMRAAVTALRKMGPTEIVVAVPVCSPEACTDLDNGVDTWCVCVQAPEPFYAVGLWYENFEQTTDDEVRYLLARAGSVGVGKTQAA
jgi:predicted phosphoribosyltransferase